MPTEHIVALLIAERDKLDRAIAALKGSGTTHTTVKRAAAKAPAANGRRALTDAGRAALSEKMKAYWAKRRAKAGK